MSPEAGGAFRYDSAQSASFLGRPSDHNRLSKSVMVLLKFKKRIMWIYFMIPGQDRGLVAERELIY